jgi:hypothetical protein
MIAGGLQAKAGFSTAQNCPKGTSAPLEMTRGFKA